MTTVNHQHPPVHQLHQISGVIMTTMFQPVHRQQLILLYTLLTWNSTTTYASLESVMQQVSMDSGCSSRIHRYLLPWYPGVEPATKKFLSAPPTSVATEQIFSAAAAGQTYCDYHSSLLGENTEKLLFLAYNSRLFDYKYWLDVLY